MKKDGTVALVVTINEETSNLVEALSDDAEILVLQKALELGNHDPLRPVYELRDRQSKEDEEFGNYVEELLSQPFIKQDVQEQGVQWLKSKIKIEDYKRQEEQATKVIATFAYELYQKNPQQKEFILSGSVARVKIKIFEIEKASSIGSLGVA